MATKVRTVASEAVKLTRSPLGIIGLFLVLVDAIAALVIVSSKLLPIQNSFLVGFIIFFPCLVLIAFYSLVTKHHQKLYSPSDFKDENNFVKTLRYNYASKKTETVEVDENSKQPSVIKKNTDSKIALEEMQSVSSTLDNVVKMQEKMLSVLEKQASDADVVSISELKENIEKNITEVIPNVVKKRMLTIYNILVVKIPGCEQLVEEFNDRGYDADVYNEEYDNWSNTPEDSKAIWVGINVPVSIAVEVIKIAKSFFPFLTYIELSGDGEYYAPEESYDDIFIGGATSTAIDHGLEKWTQQDFDKLNNNMTKSEFHSLIKKHYRLTT